MMKKNIDNNHEIYSLANEFFEQSREELFKCRKLYGKNNSKLFKTYYFNLLKERQYFEYIKYFNIERILPLLTSIKQDILLLDAGCGLGTESILSALVGATVVGVDISHERLNIARLRKEYFEELYNRKLKIQFLYKNILNHYKKYDIIWVNEAISHIDPLDLFLQRCYRNLNNQGKLIISDANKLNPYVFFQSKKDQLQSGAVYKQIIKNDLQNGPEISYAVERIFSVPTISRLLSKYFEVREIKNVRFLPYFFFRFCPKLTIKRV